MSGARGLVEEETTGARASMTRFPVPETGTHAEKVAAMDQQMAQVFTEADAEHPRDWRQCCSGCHRRPDPKCPRSPGPARGQGAGSPERAMKIGITCPYSWDVPGGVQQHIRDLAEELIDEGHEVSVIYKGDDDTPLPRYVVGAGQGGAVPTTDRWRRLSSASCRCEPVRRWIKEGGFDVLHVHGPVPSTCRCWPAGGHRADRRHRAHRDPAIRILLVTYPVVRTEMRRSTGGSRCPRRPAPRWSSTSAVTRWSSRTAWPPAAPQGGAAAGLAGTRRRDRLPRPS